MVQNGKIVGYEIVNGGAGYSSNPTITLPGFSGHAVADLVYGKSFEKNGSIRSISNR
jgi:hypothetical protein